MTHADRINDMAAECDAPEVTPKDAWFIWQKYGKPPKFAHATEQGALAEAARLAARHPGVGFLVMHVIHKVRGESPASHVAEREG